MSDPANPATGPEAVRAAFRLQSHWCGRLGSPFTARLCALVAHLLDEATPLGRRILNWPAPAGPDADSVPLRLAGGLHALVRRGRLPRLAAFYPPNPMHDDAQLRAALADALRDAEAELAGWLDNPPQTNEVARSAVLMAGLLVVAAETGLPLALYELGASAGLNLMLDRYAYRLGGLRIGRADAPFELAPAWDGLPPPDAPIRILRRRGVDRAPIDIAAECGAERLVGYIWPDQTERLARTLAAIRIARADPPPIDRGDAADWLEDQIVLTPEPGVARVAMHSIAFQYFPPTTQACIAGHLARAGMAATRDAPLAWLRFEVDPAARRRPALSLTLWPNGNERILAFADPHIRAVRWVGGPDANLIE